MKVQSNGVLAHKKAKPAEANYFAMGASIRLPNTLLDQLFMQACRATMGAVLAGLK